MIEVVSAVIIHAGRILLTQRRPEKDFPYAWESPGGKIEHGESIIDALRRELREEIGVERIDVGGEPIWSGRFENKVQRSGREDVLVTLFLVTLDREDQSITVVDEELYAVLAKPRPMEGQGIGWFTDDEMIRLQLAPANQAARWVVAELVWKSRSR